MLLCRLFRYRENALGSSSSVFAVKHGYCVINTRLYQSKGQNRLPLTAHFSSNWHMKVLADLAAKNGLRVKL